MKNKEKIIIGVSGAVIVTLLLWVNKKEVEKNEEASLFNLGTLSSGFNNLSSGVINWFDDTRQDVGNVISPIQDDIGSLIGGVSNSTSNFFGNIWDIFTFGGVGANAAENTPTDYSQFGTAENPTGYYVVSRDIQNEIDNGANEPSLFDRFRDWGSGLFQRDSNGS